jgi:hypothetical protein
MWIKEGYMDKEAKTIGELKEMPKNDGWEEPQTIGESEGWMGTIEEW